jgi:bifunctional DNA-binding transcriptional regulator/antitoxin component of YhaV-PrlF toxin-antitoxin module
MGWKEGDVLEWQQRQDGTWFITKADEEEDDGE